MFFISTMLIDKDTPYIPKIEWFFFRSVKAVTITIGRWVGNLIESLWKLLFLLFFVRWAYGPPFAIVMSTNFHDFISIIVLMVWQTTIYIDLSSFVEKACKVYSHCKIVIYIVTPFDSISFCRWVYHITSRTQIADVQNHQISPIYKPFRKSYSIQFRKHRKFEKKASIIRPHEYGWSPRVQCIFWYKWRNHSMESGWCSLVYFCDISFVQDFLFNHTLFKNTILFNFQCKLFTVKE